MIMALLAFAAPILPGKTEQWKRFIQELQGPRYHEFKASRDRVGVHERTFLQSTPQGEFVVVTLEGNDPAKAFQEAASSQDTFTRWFIQQVKELHGFDLSQGLPGSVPELVADSEKEGMQRKAA
jgi:hypothetical protein